MIAHHHKVQKGHRKYLVIILAEDVNIDTLPRELVAYLRTYTYIDGRHFRDNPYHPKYEEYLKELRKRIRFTMPTMPLRDARNQINQQQT